MANIALPTVQAVYSSSRVHFVGKTIVPRFYALTFSQSRAGFLVWSSVMHRLSVQKTLRTLQTRSFSTSLPTMAAPVHRCSHVGSWLRPAEVKEQRTAFFEKKIGADELRKTEDKHIAQVVKEQQAAGLKVS